MRRSAVLLRRARWRVPGWVLRVLPLALPAGAAVWLAGCGAARLPVPAAHNVIFILVDTLRADHLALYGYRRDTAPALTALAGESVLFGEARSQATCTFPSVNSLLTSRSASAFLGQPGGAMGLPAGIPGLAEILRGHGFHTVAVSASPVVRQSPSRFNPGGGYGRGFDTFQEDCVWQSADCVTGEALAQVDGGRRPLFLYLHYLDPHGPYTKEVRPGYRHRWAQGSSDKEFIRKGDPNPIGAWLYKGAPNPGATAADVAYLEDLYDDEIGFFDGQLARLLARLRGSGLLDDAILVFAADHGEEFLEHGDVKHCRNLFDTTLRTPLLLRVPGARARRSDAAVSNLDVVPTLLDLLGIAAPGGGGVAPAGGGAGAAAPMSAAVSAAAAFEGRSLRPAIEGRALAPAWQFAAQGTLRSVADGRLKLVLDTAARRFTLYDLAADPGETHDVLAARRRDFQRLRTALEGWLAATERRPAADLQRRADEAARRLRSVGYLD
jgi:arylsulfatase A-like enzyme